MNITFHFARSVLTRSARISAYVIWRSSNFLRNKPQGFCVSDDTVPNAVLTEPQGEVPRAKGSPPTMANLASLYADLEALATQAEDLAALAELEVSMPYVTAVERAEAAGSISTARHFAADLRESLRSFFGEEAVA